MNEIWNVKMQMKCPIVKNCSKYQKHYDSSSHLFLLITVTSADKKRLQNTGVFLIQYYKYVLEESRDLKFNH